MKFINKLAAVAALILALACPARAQTGLNMFAEPRTIILTTPQVITATRSNDVVDIHGYEGIAKVDIMISTNSQTGTSTVQLFTSPDRTNWTALANYAIAVPTAKIYTNLYYGTGTPLATNIYNYPGTVTTPTASSAGWATTYLLPAPFTNTGSFTVTNYATIGFNAQDVGRYLQIAYTISSQTNSVAAIVTCRKQQE